MKSARAALSGIIAGALSVLAFTVIHNLWISDIWDSLTMMLAVGSVCGASLGWSYALVAKAPSRAGWVRYNALYVVVLMVLGLVSLLVFEPVTTIGELLHTRQPPIPLIKRTLPMMLAFTLATAMALSVLYRTDWRGALALLLTSILLIFPLGLNISILGLVQLSGTALRALAAMFGLVLLLGSVYASSFILLERKRLLARR
ncbi:MAG TPA: hypothetical protein VLT17_04980 [Gemmatimonadales bacterium]|nr:hypothetical protein [Gemmatimonadales bacterium]